MGRHMVHDYKVVSIYADSEENLIIIPNGESPELGLTMEIDLVNELNCPYSDEQLEETLLNNMDQCYSILPDETSKQSVLEKHLGVRGYSKATNGRKHVIFKWSASDGYLITPTVRKRGYFLLPDQAIALGKSFKNGELANAVKKALVLSSC
jgi:hypothetical protein